MKNIYLVTLITSLLVSFNVYAIPEPDEPVVYLRDDCGSLNNCYTSFTQLLDWVWTVRLPSKALPLLIDVGPGEFPLQASTLYCDGEASPRGNITLRGSGRDNTTLYSSTPQTLGAVIKINKCDNLSFRDITIRGAIGEAEWGRELEWWW